MCELYHKFGNNVNLFLNSEDPGEGDHELQIGAKFFRAVRIARLWNPFLGPKKKH